MPRFQGSDEDEAAGDMDTRAPGSSAGAFAAAGDLSGGLDRGLERTLNYGAPLSAEDIRVVTKYLDIDDEELWTVIDVETRGCGFYPSKRPVILFERHKFYEFTKGFEKTHPDLSNPEAGGYLTHDAEYGRLTRAKTLNKHAALRSTSWGLGQVMGFNAELAGYADVEDMVADLERSEGAQLRALARFIKKKGLDGALRRRDWAEFAKGYNGAGYRKNQYDERLAASYARLKKGPLPDLMVRSTQLCLLYLGYDPRGVDGLMGGKTRSALNRFQEDAALKVTDDVDERTLGFLEVNADRLERGSAASAIASTGFVDPGGAMPSPRPAPIGIDDLAGKSGGGTALGALAATVGVGADEATVMVLDVAEEIGAVKDVGTGATAAATADAGSEEARDAGASAGPAESSDTPGDAEPAAAPAVAGEEEMDEVADDGVEPEAGAEAEGVTTGADESPAEPADAPADTDPTDAQPVEETSAADVAAPTPDPVTAPATDSEKAGSAQPVAETPSASGDVSPAEADGLEEPALTLMDVIGWFTDGRDGNEVRQIIGEWIKGNQYFLEDIVTFIAKYPEVHYALRVAIFLLLGWMIVRAIRHRLNRASVRRFLRKSLKQRSPIARLLLRG